MRSVLFYIAGAATVGAFFTLWCVIAVQRVRKESEASKYGELCARIRKQERNICEVWHGHREKSTIRSTDKRGN